MFFALSKTASRPNRFDQARWALVDRQAMPRGRYIFAPIHANISLTKRCNSQCPHCAPASDPHSTQTLTRTEVERYIDGLRDLPIITLHVEGGEPLLYPDLVMTAFSTALARGRINCYQLETNLFWCHSERLMRGIFDRLVGIGLATPEIAFFLCGNVDQLHGASSLENSLRVVSTFYDYFPSGRFCLSHTYSPGDQTMPAFVERLRQKGLLYGIEAVPLGEGEIITTIKLLIGGEIKEITIDNKFPILIGRARQFCTTQYFEWMKKHGTKLNWNLREGNSLFYPKRPVPEILTLGWDGLLYHDVMFMHTAIYPIGAISTDLPDDVVTRANKDPLIRRLIDRGFGSVFRAAKKIIPDLEAAYENAQQSGLSVVEFAIDSLASPENNLAVLRAIIEEEGSGRLPDFRSIHSARTLEEAKRALTALSQADWTGMESKFIAAVVSLIENLSPDEIIPLLKSIQKKGETGILVLSLAKNFSDPDKKVKLLRLVTADPNLLDHFASSGPDYYFGILKAQAITLMRAMFLGREDGLSELVDRLGETELDEAVFFTIDNILALGLEGNVMRLLTLLPPDQRDRLISHVYAADIYVDKVAGKDLRRLAAVLP